MSAAPASEIGSCTGNNWNGRLDGTRESDSYASSYISSRVIEPNGLALHFSNPWFLRFARGAIRGSVSCSGTRSSQGSSRQPCGSRRALSTPRAAVDPVLI